MPAETFLEQFLAPDSTPDATGDTSDLTPTDESTVDVDTPDEVQPDTEDLPLAVERADEDDTLAEPEAKPLGDGRTIPAELKALIQANPAQAKLLKDLYFTNARYNKFGKVADLQKLKDTLGSFGSIEEAQALRERLDEIGDLDALVDANKNYATLNEKFTAGDPAYVEHLAKTSPEAFAKIAPNFLARFGADHPEQYNYLMAQVVTSTLVNNGAYNNLSLINQALASGNVEQAKAAVQQLQEGLGAIQQLSQKAPAVRQADPRNLEFEKQKQQLDQQRQELFVNDIKRETTSWVSPEISKSLVSYGKAVTPSLAKRLDSAIKEDIGAALSQNAQFQSKLKGAMQRGDRDGMLRLYKQFVSPLLGASARKVAAEFGLKALPKKPVTPGSVTPTNVNGARVDPGWEPVNKYPHHSEIRRDIPNFDDLAAKDQFILKNGKKIKVVF